MHVNNYRFMHIVLHEELKVAAMIADVSKVNELLREGEEEEEKRLDVVIDLIELLAVQVVHSSCSHLTIRVQEMTSKPETLVHIPIKCTFQHSFLTKARLSPRITRIHSILGSRFEGMPQSLSTEKLAHIRAGLEIGTD